MRKILLGCVVTTGLMLATLAANRAEAMTISTPAAVAAAVEPSALSENVAYICRRVWRCGPWGCGWRRSCGWTPGYYGYGYGAPYAYYGWGGGRRGHRHRW